MVDLDQEFQQAADQAKNLVAGSDNEELAHFIVELDALYKQATIGDCDQPSTDDLDDDERNKRAAWENLKGMSKKEAKEAYIRRLQDGYRA